MHPRDLTVFSGIIVIVLYSFNAITQTQAQESTAYYENRIIKDIIGKYESKVRPVANPSDTVNVTLDITFNNIIDLYEKFQILKSSIWVRQTWTNPLVKWNPSEYGNLTSVIVDSRQIWLPDVALYNNINDESHAAHLDQRITRVRIYSSGFTFWAAPYIFQTLCKINVENFPFDTQHCKLNFGSWQYDGNEVNIINPKTVAAMSTTRTPSGEWDVLKVEIKRSVKFYACCKNLPYPEIGFTIHMKRKPLFFIVNLIIPNILIALLAFFSFYIPVESGERISFVITVLLSMTVFMLLIAESIPPTSDAVPLIGIYYTFSIIEVFLALTATAVSLRINYSYLFGDGLSPSSKHLIFNNIGLFLGFDVSNMLGVKTREKPRPNPSTITYGGCHCARQASSPSPTNEMRDCTDMICNGGSRQSSHGTYNYLETSLNNRDDQRESLMLNVMDNMDYGRRKQGHGMANDQDERDLTTKDREDQKIKESKLAAAIIDRLFLWIFTTTYVVSSAVILCIPLFRSIP